MNPVRAARAARHRQGPHPDALGNYILGPYRLAKVQQAVDVIEHELPVLIRHADLCSLRRRVRGADTGLRPHGDQKKQASIAGEEGQHPAAVRHPIDNEVNTLRKKMPVAGLDAELAVEFVRPGPTGIDQHARPGGQIATRLQVAQVAMPDARLAPRLAQADVVCRGTAHIQRSAHKSKHKAGVVVVQIAV